MCRDCENERETKNDQHGSRYRRAFGESELMEWFEAEAGRPRIEDRTHSPRTRQTRREKGHPRPRSKSQVYALVLHQMACCRRRKEGGYDTIGVHYAILEDGRILQLQPIEALMYASNGFNARSVAVEFAGNFPNIRGKCWQPKCDKLPCPNHGCHQLTQAQIDSGRYLVEHLLRESGMKLTHILAHRQSSGTRENDPGPDIWYHVGQWAIDKYGLKDGGPGFKVGSGRPIPDEWRDWGRRGRARPPVQPSRGQAPQPGRETLAVRQAIAGGRRDVNQLTNMVFFGRHPERGGKKLVKTEPGFKRLADEWLSIRDRLVRPALRAHVRVR